MVHWSVGRSRTFSSFSSSMMEETDKTRSFLIFLPSSSFLVIERRHLLFLSSSTRASLSRTNERTRLFSSLFLFFHCGFSLLRLFSVFVCVCVCVCTYELYLTCSRYKKKKGAHSLPSCCTNTSHNYTTDTADPFRAYTVWLSLSFSVYLTHTHNTDPRIE